MTDALNGFYAAYLSGKAAQGFAMLIFRNGKIVGAGGWEPDRPSPEIDILLQQSPEWRNLVSCVAGSSPQFP
jgi:hypothetical protein